MRPFQRLILSAIQPRVDADEEGTVLAVRGHMDALELVVGLHPGPGMVKTMGEGILPEL